MKEKLLKCFLLKKDFWSAFIQDNYSNPYRWLKGYVTFVF